MQKLTPEVIKQLNNLGGGFPPAPSGPNNEPATTEEWIQGDWIFECRVRPGVLVPGDLPLLDNTRGDVRFVIDEGAWYWWDGAAWQLVVGDGAVDSVTATAPISSSGGANPNISLTGIVPVANGGTGIASPGAAGNVLTSNGAVWTSSPPITTSPAAPLTSVQFNNGGNFGGSAGLTWNGSTLAVDGAVDRATAGTLTLGGTTANAITVGKAGVTTTFPGPVELVGDVTTVGGTQFTTDAQFDGNITLGSDASDNIALLGQVSTAITQEGIAAPAVSPASTGRIYFDSGSNKFRMSQNGGAYTDVGTVTSVGITTTLSGISSSPAPITGSGTLQLTGTLGTASGGTGLTSLSAGGILVGNGPGNNVFVVNSVASGRVLLSNGAGFFPIWGQVDLTTAVTNALPVPNGGTGLGVVPAGAVLVGNTASQLAPVSPGSAGNVLTSNGTTWTSAAPSGGVSGSGTATQLAYFTGATALGSETAVGADALTWNVGSNSLGIRTSAPTRALEVSGDDALINTVRIGLGAGAIATNTALGTAALNTNTTGELNTAVGRNTLFSNSTGTELTAVGYNALTSNTASFNTAVGTGALEDNTTGTRNTAMGRRSMANSVAGSDNTAVGYQSLLLMNGGANNTAVGSSAADAITTGANSVAVGSGALGAVTTGNDNTALGASALLTLAGAGSQSTAVGASAQQNATVGGSTAVGYQAGFQLGGLRSTALGVQAMGATTSNGGEDSVAVGQQALNAAGANGTQNVAVGNQSMLASTTGQFNTAVGYQSLFASNVGNFATAIGWGAVASVLTAAADGITAVGAGALAANTSGSGNTAVGYFAGNLNSTGSQSTYVGYQSGWKANGGSNTGLGYRALGANAGLTGSANAAVGRQAGEAVTSGSQNAFLGASAGQFLTSGSANVAVGESSLGASTTGTRNVAVGQAAMIADTQGTDSVAVGYRALDAQNPAAAGAMNNVAVGSGAGGTVTLGTGNTLIGTSAGSRVTTGDNNVIVGNGADVPVGFGNSDNTIVIGQGASSPSVLTNSITLGNSTNDYFRLGTTSITVPNPGIDFSETGGFGVGATPLMRIGHSSATTNTFFIVFYAAGGADGWITGDGAGGIQFTSVSDYRLKSDFQEIADPLARLNALRPCSFRMSGKFPEARRVEGFVAHEVQQVVPEAVSGEKDAVDDQGNPKYQGLDQSRLLPLVVKAAQELAAKAAAAEARADAAEARLAALEAVVASLQGR